MEYCLGNGFWVDIRVDGFCCVPRSLADSSVNFSNAVIAFVYDTSIIEINGIMIVFPRTGLATLEPFE